MPDKIYEIEYLGHSAFVVTTESYYLFFDYVGTTEYAGYRVVEKNINFAEFQDKKIIMFYSPDHFDHYNKDLHLLTQKYDNIVSVLGAIESNLKNTITVLPREVNAVDEAKIYTGASSDLGVCYLIEIDNLVIYYGGDNANWGDDDEVNSIYYQEIDYLANLNLKVDVAFIPVCNFSGQRPDAMTKGALYSINKLNPQLIIPMHAAGKESLYQEFASDAKAQNCSHKIVCLDQIGQIYKNGK